MRSWLPLVLVVAGIAVFLTYGSIIGPRSRAHILQGSDADFAPGVVDTVSDGDTIHLSDGRRVRLLQIDAPEFAKEDCYAEEARRRLSALAPLASTITLTRDRRLDAHDRFGRVLAYVYARGMNLNVRMVQLGAAAPYFFGGRRGRFAAALLDAARTAKLAGRGLWGACPSTPLDPRHRIQVPRAGGRF
jgi:endonuclease YncB( thermonuclease family)